MMVLPQCLSLHGAQGLATIEEACRRLASALSVADSLVIDVGAVEEVDIAFLQLVVATRKSAQVRGKTLSWRAAENAPLVVAMRRAGLDFDLEGQEGAGR